MIPLMEESGQTEEERRRLRQKQRSLQMSIVAQTEAMENASSEVFGKVREKNNDLFQRVFYTREAVLDGDTLNMISERAAKQVEGLVQVSFVIQDGGGCASRVSHMDKNAYAVIRL
jgi:predicted  nucleic acid-binding Zn-ribbon protein